MADRILPAIASGTQSRKSHESERIPYKRLTNLEVAGGVFAVFAWIGLLAIGIVVSSKIYRDALTDPTKLSLGRELQDWIMICVSYTVTNVALLCCLASYLGALGRRAKIGGNEEADQPQMIRNVYLCAMLRGFFTYLALLSGVVLVGDKMFVDTTPGDYIHLAGLASLFSFLIGHDAHLFLKMTSKLQNMAETRVLSQEGRMMDSAGRATIKEKREVTAVVQTTSHNGAGPTE